MGDLLEFICAGIESDDEEAFLAANEFVRAFRRGTSDNVGLVAPYDSMLREDPPSEAQVRLLGEIVRNYLIVGKRANAARACGILGELQSSESIELLRNLAHDELVLLLESNRTFFCALCALSDCGELVHSRGGIGIMQLERNVSDARKYFESLGRVVPW